MVRSEDMMLTFYRKDKEGATYYYTIHDRQGSLFTEYTLTTTWGRNLGKSREKIYTFHTRQELDVKLREIIEINLKRGYRVLYSYFRADDAEDLKTKIQTQISSSF
ncbi:MAG TPA: hypothetical protein PLG79_00405 [Spirochaetales bacterium]|nr:hypothetical protein [Spirochaetales bacterium]